MAKNLYCAVISFSTRTAIFAAINPVSPADLLFKR